MSEKICIGIDVSKESLDVATSCQERCSYANDEGGLEALVQWLRTRGD